MEFDSENVISATIPLELPAEKRQICNEENQSTTRCTRKKAPISFFLSVFSKAVHWFCFYFYFIEITAV